MLASIGQSSAINGKYGVIIANTGTPSSPTPEAVRAYLAEFLSDPRICPMNPHIWQLLLRSAILPRRSIRSAQKYATIWTENGSPLQVTMESLSRELENALNEEENRFRVAHAMAYGEPSIQSVFQSLADDGCDKFVVIPLYPQSAHSTTMVIKDKLESALSKLGIDSAKVAFIDDYSESELYIDAICSSITESGYGQSDHDRLLFAFHSIPIADVDAGDTYPNQVQKTVELVVDQLGLDDDSWQLAYQCRFDKSRKWLSPTTGKALDGLASKKGRLFVVAPNFSIDCLETLFDIEVELRERHAQVRPHEEFAYVGCLNDSDEHVRLIKSLVKASLDSA